MVVFICQIKHLQPDRKLNKRFFYFYSYADIRIRRDDDHFVQTIRIKKCQSVSDLLEESRMRLNFKKDDQLSAHKISHDERIADSVRIHKIARLGTVVIKRREARAIREDAATGKKHGLASISVKQNGNSNEIRHRSDLPQSETRRRDNTRRAGAKYGSKQNEIRTLNMKLEVHSKFIEGFVYKIVAEECIHVDKRKNNMSTFFSRNEHAEKRSKIRVIPSWSNWQPQKELPCWGVRINSNNVDKNNPSEFTLHRNKNRETSGIHRVLVKKTYFYQVREFPVNVTINEKAVEEVKKILEIKTKRGKQQAVKEFNDKYCSFVYSGNFCAGACLATVADACCVKPPNGQDSTNLLKECALEETKYYWSREIQGKRSLSYQFLKSKDPNVTVRVYNRSDPLRIQNMRDLQEAIREVRNWTVFPANWDDKSYFTPVYKIMQSQAEANKDEDLRRVSAMFKEYMEGKTAFFIFGSLVGNVCDELQDRVSYSPPNLL